MTDRYPERERALDQAGFALRHAAMKVCEIASGLVEVPPSLSEEGQLYALSADFISGVQNEFAECMTKFDAALALPAVEAPAELRPEVRAFANLMEMRLRANDHKPGWKRDHIRNLECSLNNEVSELSGAMLFGVASEIGSEAADVANFAMMIADVAGALQAASDAGDEDPCDFAKDPPPAAGQKVDFVAVDKATEYRPMSEAPKDGTVIWAKVSQDLTDVIWAGLQIPILHRGVMDGFDPGWDLAAPVGYGGLAECWFVGWRELDEQPARYAELRASRAETNIHE